MSTVSDFDASLQQSIDRLNDMDAVARLYRKDSSLWSDDSRVQGLINNRLGWLSHLDEMKRALPGLREFVRRAERQGRDRALIIGMGGSSLWPDVISQHLRTKRGMRIRVLDSTHPDALDAACEWAGEGDALFIVATKSGSTLETLSLYERVRQAFPDGRRYVAITDPQSPLLEIAARDEFQQVFVNPPDIGGRFSATSLFGLVPAALAGVDLDAALEASAQMLEDCSVHDAKVNPAAQLAAFMYAGHLHHRWVVRLSFGRDIAMFGAWVEQLVAESTGKGGVGLLPVPGALPEDALDTSLHHAIAVCTRTFAHPDDPFVDRCEAVHTPVHDLVMPAKTDLWAEVVRWEVATALLGALLRLNPFDEPDVASAKRACQAVLTGEPSSVKDSETLTITSVKATSKHLTALASEAEAGEVVVILAYIAPTEANHHRMSALLEKAQRDSRATVSLQFGPRYLHSTGQLHKGGPKGLRFVLLDDHQTLSTCAQSPDLARIIRAQAEGDRRALTESGREVVSVRVVAAT